MKRIAKTAGTLGLMGCAVMNSPLAVADDSGWYAGANIGQSRAKIDDARITAQMLVAPTTSVSIIDDNRDTSYKLFGGYRYNKNVAVEAGYFDLGQFGFTAATVPAGTLTGKIKLKGLNLDAVGTLPLTEKFSALGRLGLNYAQTRDSFIGTGAATVLNPNPSKNQINYKLGAGLQYDLTQSLGMRVEAERYRINDAVGNRGDVDMYSLGLVYRFGVEKPAPAPRAAEPEPVAAPKPVVVAPPPPPRKVVFSADSSVDSLFDFGKAIVKPTGKQALDRFAADLKGADYEVITVTGHTDRIGSRKYNQKLSERRAEMVKAYLVESAGIPASKIKTRGVDGAEPVTKPGECKSKKGARATKQLIACLAPDRRVEVEVIATRTSE